MEIKTCIFTQNDCYRQGSKIIPNGIIVHSTGANNPTLKRYLAPNDGIIGENLYNNDWNRSGINKCVHAFIGKDKGGTVRCYQTLPWDMRSWGCGSGKEGSYNNSHIQFEICEDGLNDENYFNEAFHLAVELCQYLMNLYGIHVENVVSHQEAHMRGYASNHDDPSEWLRKYGKNMDWFRSQLTKNQTNNAVDIYYNSYFGGKWNENIKNAEQYSGKDGVPIHCIMAKVTEGSICTRVHVKGATWLPWVSGYDPMDEKNGYAGRGDKEIDAVQFEVKDLPNHEVYYRVSTTSSAAFLPWVKGTTDYAGIFGKTVDKVQAYIS